MYSVVMLMAMSGTPDLASFGGRGCHGGSGCGGYSGSCWGGNGCGGGCRGGLFQRHGGCCGHDACGCGGGRGGLFSRRGGCCGNNACGCGGYQANCGCCGVQMNCGCCGAMASCGCYGAPAMQVMPATTGGEKKGAMVPAPANLVINLPADAKLTFDGLATSSTSNVRQFVTPTLNAGIDHTYTLAAEIVRDGKTLKSAQIVTVRAGETTEVNFVEATFATTVVKN